MYDYLFQRPKINLIDLPAERLRRVMESANLAKIAEEMAGIPDISETACFSRVACEAVELRDQIMTGL